MRFGKTRMFFYFNGLIAFVLFLYFLPWAFSNTTTGKVISPFYANTLHVLYTTPQGSFHGEYLRSDVPYSERWVSIRYLRFDPAESRVNSFMGIAAEPLAWWSIFLLASAMLLLTHNLVFSKGTMFQLHRKFPWISMEEYFPIRRRPWEKWQNRPPVHPNQARNSTGKLLK